MIKQKYKSTRRVIFGSLFVSLSLLGAELIANPQQVTNSTVPNSQISSLPLSKNEAPTDEKLKVMVVDMQEIWQSVNVAKDINKQIEQRQAQYAKEISAEEEKLKKIEEDLTRQSTVLSKEVYNQRRKDFEDKYLALNKKFQERKSVLDAAYNEARNHVMKDLLDIIASMAEEKKVSLVLQRQQIVLVHNSMNVTQEVIEKLNKKIPTLQVQFPKLESVSQATPAQKTEAAQ